MFNSTNSSFNSLLNTFFFRILIRNHTVGLPKFNMEAIANAASAYRMIQVLHIKFMQLFSKFFIPTIYICCIIGTLIINYCIIRLHSQIPNLILIIFIICLIYLIVLISFTLRVGASIYMDSIVFTKSYKTKIYNERKLLLTISLTWTRQVFQSFTPIKITIPGIAFIKRSTVMTSFGFILYGTLKLVVLL